MKSILWLLLAILLVEQLSPALAAQGANVTCPFGHFQIEDKSSNTLYNTNDSDIHPQLMISLGKKPLSMVFVLNGPVLGVESSDFKADLACTSDGITISGTILHNRDYYGVQTASYIWRPIIKVTAILNKAITKKADINIISIWRMRLPNGAMLNTVDTPQDIHQSYPITIKKTFPLPTTTYLQEK